MKYLDYQTAQGLVNKSIQDGAFGSSDDALKSLVARGYSIQGWNDSPQNAIKNKSTYIKKKSELGQIFETRSDALQKTKERQQSGQQTAPETLLQTAGQVVGTAWDVAGAAIKGAYHLLPDDVERAINKGASAVGKAFLDTPVGQSGLTALQSGLESYTKWSKENPRAAANLESVVNIAMLFPAGRVAGVATKGASKLAKPVIGAAKEATTLGRAGVVSGLEKSAQATAKSLLAPTKEATKRATLKVLPKLTKEIPVTTSILRTAEKNTAKAGQAIGDWLENNVVKGSVKTAKLVDMLNSTKKSWVVSGKDLAPQKTAIVNQLTKTIKSFGIEMKGDVAQQVKTVWSNLVQESKGFTKDLKAGTLADLQKKLSGVVREELAKANPDLATLNQKYTLWKTTLDVAKQTAERRVGQTGIVRKGGAAVLGAAIAPGGIEAKAGGAYVMKLLSDIAGSDVWKTLNIKVKNGIADWIAMGDTEALKKAAQIIKSNPKSAANRLKTYVSSRQIGQGIKDVNKMSAAELKAAGLSDITSQQKKTLTAVHNLSAKNLKKADEIGGLANPSIAVYDPKKLNFESFGEITLIAPEDILTSSKVKTFASDVYSPRFPKTSTTVKDFRIIENKLKKFENIVDEKLWNIDTSDISNSLENSALSMADFLSSKKIPLPKASSSSIKNQMSEIIQKKSLDEDYLKYVKNLITEAGGEERIFNGYTPSGNRRYISPVTAENVSKMLNKDSVRGGENFFYGLGSVRSKIAPEFRSVSAIKKAQGRLVSKTEFNKIKATYDKKFTDLIDELQKFSNNSKNEFGDYGRAGEALGEYIGGDSSALSYSFENIPQNTLNKIKDFAKALQEMPTEYFEAKFKRVVDIKEFSHAVVPDNTPKEIMDLLKSKNIVVETYKNNNYASREEVTNRLLAEKGLLFGLGVLAVGGSQK